MGSQSLAVSGVGLHLPSPRSTMLKIVLILFLSALMAETAPAEQDRMFMGPIYHNYKIKGQRLRINRAVKTRTAKICGQKCTFYNTKNSGAAETCAAWIWRQNNKKKDQRVVVWISGIIGLGLAFDMMDLRLNIGKATIFFNRIFLKLNKICH